MTGKLTGGLRLGTGRCDITPAPGTPQGGWGAQTHQRGLGADLPFFATALVIADSSQEMAIVDVDAIGFDQPWTEKILDAIGGLTKIPRENIRFSCTHTHSGANTFRLKTISEGLDMIGGYLDGLPQRIASAVWQAQNNLRPVRCAAASGKCEINVNRRLKLPDGRVVVGKNPEGPVDPTVRVVRFDDLDENPVATIVHYACHPTTMAWQCEYFTPDYPGWVRQVVERQVGGICLFLQGAAGDLAPIQGFTGDLKIYRRLGEILGLEASKIGASIDILRRRGRLVGVLQSGAPIAIYEDDEAGGDEPVLRLLSRVLKLPLREFASPVESEAEADELRKELSRARAGGDEEEIRLAMARATQAGMRAERARLYHGKKFLNREMQGIRIGSIALLSIPGEPFIEINHRIVAGSPFAQTLFSGYSNGGFGYIPVRSAFEEGGYEVDTSPFSPDAAEVVIKEGLAMLKDLAAGSN
jgi:Neutral/alkaline non-lysosomal ceramidase, N-terminal